MRGGFCPGPNTLMKRFLAIASVVVGLVLVAGFFAWLRLPTVVTFLLGKAIGGRVEARESTVSWSRGVAAIELTDLTLSGGVQGTVKRAHLDIRVGRGLYIKNGSVSDFNVIIVREKRGGRFLPFQVEYAEVLRGKAVYKGQAFTINRITIRNFNTAGQFEFSVDGAAEGFGKIKSHGSGIWRGGRSDIKGAYEISSFDLSRLFRTYEGRCDSKGRLTYRAGELGLHGVAGADRFLMREPFLKKPVRVQRVDCTIDIDTYQGKTETKLGRLLFKGTPLALAFTTSGKRLERLEMVSEFLDVRDLKEYLSFSFVKRLPTIMDAVSGGKVGVRKLIYAKPDSFAARLSLVGVEARYRDFRFVGITGGLEFDGEKMILDNLEARSGNSILSGISGAIPFSEKKGVRISGRYNLDLADLSPFAKKGDIRICSGSAAGVAVIRGKKEEDIHLEGNGRLRDAVFSWKNLLFVAAGSYTFDKNGIDCSPMMIRRDATRLQVRGRIDRDSMSLKIEGQIDAADVGRFYSLPYPLAGSAGVDGRVEGKKGEFSWEGAVSMDALFFEIPGFVEKRIGVPSFATFQGRTDGGDLHIENLTYTIGTIEIHVTGKVDRNRISDLRIKMDAPNLDRVSELLLAKGLMAKGAIRADLMFHHMQLPYPRERLPRINGYVTVKNGYLALPFLPQPLQNMDVVCAFTGDRYELDAAGFRVGATSIERAKLVVGGVERPRISLLFRAGTVNLDDIRPKSRGGWHIHAIRSDSLASRILGDIAIEARHVQWNDVGLNNFHAKLSLAHGKLSLDDSRSEVFGGRARAEGSVDLLANKPRFELAGRIDQIAWGEVFKAIRNDTEIMHGGGALRVDLVSKGENAREILEGLSGRIVANSNDGVIHKWPLLSKIFGLLNLYDLLQGKINLAEEGLPYTTMSAEFTGKNGVLRTPNFLVDSPSMFISGQGAVALPDGTVEGRVSVSPLVAVDKVLNKIPVVRSVFRGKKEGFLFVVYNISGPLHDPEISSTYVESVGMRAYMILRNLLLLPREVIEP